MLFAVVGFFSLLRVSVLLGLGVVSVVIWGLGPVVAFRGWGCGGLVGRSFGGLALWWGGGRAGGSGVFGGGWG
ncbi:MAG: hypothetical protein IPH22_02365 [Nitrosomonas sp.]|nr:hypothetical protein [Nitrosomonas sp.]